MDVTKTYLHQRIFMAIAALSGAAAVILGAYASHGLKSVLTVDSLAIIQTALDYQFIHTLALLFVSLVPIKPSPGKSRLLILAGSLFVAGILFFSVNLYVIQIFHFNALSKLTPLGGFMFIMGWLTLFILAFKKTDAEKNTDQ